MKIAHILNSTDNEFSPEFYKALDTYFEEVQDRTNAFQQISIEQITNEEDFEPCYLIIQKELQAKGYTDEHLLLVDNTW